MVSKSDPYDVIFQTWVMKSAHQNAAGGVTLGWVPLVLFLRCAYLCFVRTHISCACIGQNMMKIIAVAKKYVIFRDIHGATDLI